MVSSGSCVVPTSQMHRCESTGALLWTMFHTHTTRQGLCKSVILGKGKTDKLLDGANNLVTLCPRIVRSHYPTLKPSI